MIHQAAIMHNGVLYTLPRPARHHDVIRLIHETEGEYDPRLATQGFTAIWEPYAERNPLFLRRHPAKRVAQRCGQLLPRECGLDELYSEDVW